MTPKTPKNQNVKKFKKSCNKDSNQGSLENKLQLELKNIKNGIFKNFKTSNYMDMMCVFNMVLHEHI